MQGKFVFSVGKKKKKNSVRNGHVFCQGKTKWFCPKEQLKKERKNRTKSECKKLSYKGLWKRNLKKSFMHGHAG